MSAPLQETGRPGRALAGGGLPRGVVRPVRLAALASALGGCAHLGTAWAHPGAAVRVLLVAMAAVCLPCAVHLWRGRAGAGTWCVTVLMAAAMVLVHLVLVASGGHGHHDPGTVSWLVRPGFVLGLPVVLLVAIGGAGYRSYRASRLSGC
ncbi:hypothetical protein [Geodermatophilus sp. CPCC 206100]|uniref:hypothetical protein n=1 Tax=Geodermatophilus sp. CPCC 206100 TaxID=3020054 RepID=UPI003B00696C